MVKIQENKIPMEASGLDRAQDERRQLVVQQIVDRINKVYPEDSGDSPFEINLSAAKDGKSSTYTLYIVKSGDHMTLAEKYPKDAQASRTFSFVKVGDAWQYSPNDESNPAVASITSNREAKSSLEIDELEKLLLKLQHLTISI